MTSALPVVCCAGVARTFGRGSRAVVAVHGVTCEVHAGKQVAVTGPSGSGKSTLLHLMAGLDTPTSGAVCWPALGDRSTLRPGRVGIVFQGPSLLDPLDIVENVALPLVLEGATEVEAHERAREALARLDLELLASRLPEELSAGQAQRVAVARALAGHPALILADEPTGQLDGRTGDSVVDALRDCATASGAALVVATHDPSVAGRLPLEWRMVDGRLQAAADDEAARWSA